MTRHSSHTSDAGAPARAIVLIGALDFLLVVLLTPPVSSRWLAMSPLATRDVLTLWILVGVIAIISGLLIAGRRRIRPSSAAFILGVWILIGVELSARLPIVVFIPEMRPSFSRLAARTYPERMACRGHPFLQFVGSQSVAPVEDETLGRLTPFNNFGLGNYTTAHSLVNFVLNVVDFDPDYVIVHHAWNENVVRSTVSGFRWDYSHALTYFHEPVVTDRHFIRASVIYRYLKQKLNTRPIWAFLPAATVNLDHWRQPRSGRILRNSLRTCATCRRSSSWRRCGVSRRYSRPNPTQPTLPRST